MFCDFECNVSCAVDIQIGVLFSLLKISSDDAHSDVDLGAKEPLEDDGRLSLSFWSRATCSTCFGGTKTGGGLLNTGPGGGLKTSLLEGGERVGVVVVRDPDSPAAGL